MGQMARSMARQVQSAGCFSECSGCGAGIRGWSDVVKIEPGMVAVVTGAGSGIGRALAEHAARQGMVVVAADVEAATLDRAVEEIVREGGQAIGIQTDVSVAEEVERLAVTVWSRFGGVQLLCNNAGVFSGGLLWERSLADWEWVLGVNFYGMVNGVRSFVPRMLAAGTPAHIVDTASMGGLVTAAYSGPYFSSKFAAVGFTECLAHDLRATDAPIGVSVLVPSLVATGLADSRRNRPEGATDHGTELKPDEEFVLAAMKDAIGGAGMPPTEVAALVFDAVEHDRFWIPTKPSYHDQIRTRHESMQSLSLPPGPELD
jgi:NAD(P)-dependent dehydrogenase (short-subunit alcohol dehydrogenase family)